MTVARGDFDSREAQRLDKWLWVARLFKTRTLAGEAVSGGKVHVDGQRVKPARPIRPGNQVRVRKGDFEITLAVRGLSRQRRPASEAVLLYQETPESHAQRIQRAEERRRRETRPRGSGRPTKRERRQISRAHEIGTRNSDGGGTQ